MQCGLRLVTRLFLLTWLPASSSANLLQLTECTDLQVLQLCCERGYAQSPGRCLSMPVLTSPEVARRMLKILAARLRVKDERLLEFSVLNVRERLISELLRLSRERGGGERVLTPPPPATCWRRKSELDGRAYRANLPTCRVLACYRLDRGPLCCINLTDFGPRSMHC